MHGIEKIIARPRRRLDRIEEDGVGVGSLIGEILVHEVHHPDHGLPADEGLDKAIILGRCLLQCRVVHNLRNEDHRYAELVSDGREQPDISQIS